MCAVGDSIYRIVEQPGSPCVGKVSYVRACWDSGDQTGNKFTRVTLGYTLGRNQIVKFKFHII